MNEHYGNHGLIGGKTQSKQNTWSHGPIGVTEDLEQTMKVSFSLLSLVHQLLISIH
jgi:hypothetical protein